ncbi:ABC transporter A family member 7-like isoform X1 [Amblyomma americanum]
MIMSKGTLSSLSTGKNLIPKASTDISNPIPARALYSDYKNCFVLKIIFNSQENCPWATGLLRCAWSGQTHLGTCDCAHGPSLHLWGGILGRRPGASRWWRHCAGNRRKLSLCISMMGMPRMILLDEPYAGISTTARKLIVNYISTLQRVSKISILLSSHSMSDVEFLCNRIAILDAGRLQCLGSLAQLKQKFGKGYTITVKTYPDKKQDFDYQRDVADNVLKNFPQAEIVHTYEGLLEFRMSRVRMLWSEMFSRMARIKQRFKLQDFFITDTSLEQIFLSVTRKEACDAAAAEAAAEAAAAQAPVIPQLNTVATTLGL